jgi:lysophospholipase L1-like esterase
MNTVLFMAMAALAVTASNADVTVAGDWQVKASAAGVEATVTVTGPETIRVTDEKISALPVYNPKGAEYARGAKLAGVRAQECSARYAIDPESLTVRSAPGAAARVRGKDYEAELTWGCVARLEGGSIAGNAAVFASYAYDTMRLDSVVLTADKQIVLRKGVPHVANPVPPALAAGETCLANVWVTPRLKRLGEENLFSVLEAAYPEPPKTSPTVAEKCLPKTMAKLKAGGKVRILAWGDSVTNGGYLPDPKTERWQEQFAQRLRARFPLAEIELVTEAWGGRNTDSYRKEPPGSIHNYQEKVLDVKPDLIVSEFVNDAGFDEAGTFQRYSRIRDEFRAIGAEWIMLTPHYVRPDWMRLTAEKNIDDDPRPYVKALRKFAAENGLALADGSQRYGRLWRQGIPYSTLMMNSINHPNAFGHGIFADALMALFP